LARVAGISIAGKSGILVRDFSSFEAAETIDAFIFDKTGTMTQGKWILLGIIPQEPFTENQALSLAAELEKTADHYIAAEIRRQAEQRDLLKGAFNGIKEITHYDNGVSGRLDDKTVKIGSRSFLSDAENLNDFVLSGRLKDEDSAVFMSYDDKLCGVFIFGDAIRESALTVSQALTSKGYFTALISGDAEETTRKVGKKIGIDRAFGGNLPHEKAAYIDGLKKEGKCVAMVGDGINDAPALIRSDLAVAIYSGSHLGKETADITLMKGDPAQLLDYLSMATKVNRKVRQNLMCALFYNVISIPVAISGLLSPLVAVSAMFMSSLTVIGNTLLLVKKSSTH
jgi:cation transport ATPase